MLFIRSRISRIVIFLLVRLLLRVYFLLSARQVINVIGEKMFEEVRERFVRGEFEDDERYCHFHLVHLLVSKLSFHSFHFKKYDFVLTFFWHEGREKKETLSV